MTTVRAVDSHAHAFCGDSYPYASDTLYQPHRSQAGTAAKFRAVLDAHGLTHGLLVGAGPYGPDNRCMLDAIAASGGRFKGIWCGGMHTLPPRNWRSMRKSSRVCLMAQLRHNRQKKRD
jgi:predicted TIM-barrel fold metal-dependent hydrolase